MARTKSLLPLLLLSLLSTFPFISSHNFDHEKCMRECEPDNAVRTRCTHACEKRRKQFVLGCAKPTPGGDTHNPYVFGEGSFVRERKTEHGRFRLLKNFASLSPVLRGVDNLRVALFEAHPLTFVMPTHSDAHTIFYVIEGEGGISILQKGSREFHNLEKGDIISVWAGSIFYLINKSKSQKLVIAKLLLPVGNLGDVQAFYSSATERADSYYQSFSIELLEAALNTKRDRLEDFFKAQKKEVIIKASEEKIRAISEHSSKSQKPFNLLKKHPSHENNRGQLFEADFNDYEHLKDLNARVSYVNISNGSMIAPFYNTRAFKLGIVVTGSGYIEIISGNVSGDVSGDGREGQNEGNRGKIEQNQGRGKYTRASSELSQDSIFVIPPGYPSAIVARGDQSLHIVCYEMPAENDERVFVAGGNNVLGEMEEEAKELAFGAPAAVVDEVLRGQKLQVFVPAPATWWLVGEI